MAHVPAANRKRHTLSTRTTHEAAGYEAPLVSAAPAQEQEAIRDQVFGTQNFMEGSVTLDKMRLQDEFGSTVLGPSGFEGSWEDTISTGIYNGSFADNDASPANALPAGRTSYVPYWTIVYGGTATATSSIGGISIFLDAASETFKITSDRINVRQSMFYRILLTERFATANAITRTIKVNRYRNGTLDDTLTLDTYADPGSIESVPTINDCGAFETSYFPDEIFNTTTEIDIEITYTWVSGATSTVAVGLYEVMLVPTDLPSGVSWREHLPTNPRTGGRFYHPQFQRWYVYTGAEWLSEQVFDYDMPISPVAPFPLTGTLNRALRGPVASKHSNDDIWIDRIEYRFFVNPGGSALSASHKWVGTFQKHPSANTSTTIGTSISIDSGSSNVWREDFDSGSVSALLNNGTTHYEWSVTWTMTGTPGTLVAYARVRYRLYLLP